MRVAVIGAGPAGLLFSLLAKRRYPSWRIEVAEHNPEGATYGFGVVFSDGALAFLERDEPLRVVRPHAAVRLPHAPLPQQRARCVCRSPLPPRSGDEHLCRRMR